MPVKLEIHPEKCVGCRTCELACSFRKTGAFAPELSRVQVVVSNPRTIMYPVACIQCAEQACVKACPVSALRKDEASNAIVLDREACTGCGLCVRSCPYSAIRMDEKSRKPLICDLCGGDPECVKWCPVAALEAKSL
ncbi:MAG: 4Fe-4S dicluster domain-containing protein [Candidatus Hadarchaeum sp.]|uniref:4Fe-4S dicluster domain-containing protein n=1 Tax=Candidatus Hadarchaeum sp. TaxID=2883567 RepID=UPI003D12AA40